MNPVIKTKIRGIVSVTIGLILVLVPYSLFIRWNLITLLLFWFVIVPAAAQIIPIWFSKNKYHVVESIAGMMIFYLIMVFMIYLQYKSDFFEVVMISFVVNILLIMAIASMKRKQGYNGTIAIK